MSYECFLLIRTTLHAKRVLAGAVLSQQGVYWAKAIYGPYQIVAYIRDDDETALIDRIEKLRAERPIAEMDVRRCKPLPEDSALPPFMGDHTQPVRACLLINVDPHITKERIVVGNLRKIAGVRMARAMWGPTDVIAIVEAADHEGMRNLICDEVKIMEGITSNTTLFCYPEAQ
ncbi:Lrp/AsnC family transcriptional regulator [Rhizobium laguerreae]|uniref:Lrp/AsnC family transcriptional regulator n=1 Tax=Rhizobium laguerreae TaxID=1076926 RepID=UPI001C928C3B|nr:Lrp/AsnC family transcriptional regulator [Rhizobium laguerreae]MBY3203456.1 Lrp/AsnC family transcriptional regulator [Rhizobium laguerreae]